MAFFTGKASEARAIGARLVPEAKSLSLIYRDHVCFTIGPDVYFGSVPVSEGYALIDQMRDILGDSPMGTIRCDTLLAGLTAMRGDEEGFFELARRVKKVWEELGNPSNRHFMGQAWAESAWILGRPVEAEERMREMKAALDERGESGNNSTVTAELAMFLAQTGRLDEAAVLIEEARAFTAPDDFGATVPIAWVDALLDSERGNHDTALAVVDEAVATVLATDYLNFTAETLRIRGQVLLAADRTEEAAASFDEAGAVWTRKENVASLRLMQAWRDEHGV
jgi:tetratricopeptide (TPR) repeat protein